MRAASSVSMSGRYLALRAANSGFCVVARNMAIRADIAAFAHRLR
jgi:hypothetical protein